MNKRTYSIPNNRYDRYLNELRNRAWNCMSKTGWDYTLYKFGRVVDDNESINNEIIGDESTNDEPIN